jgi:hypothetical protein
MARTIEQIYDSMNAEKMNMTTLNSLQPNINTFQTLLTDLTSPSKVAIWRLIFYVMAAAIWILETLFDQHKTEVETLLNNTIPGTVPWYRDLSLKFQYGYALAYINNKFQYPTIDLTAQIVKYAAAVEGNGIITIKTATITGGELSPLSTIEHNAFKAYIAKTKYAGSKINFITDIADSLKIAYTIYYDPLLLAADGSLLSDSATFPVEDAINNYCVALPFNGTLNLTKITDAVQNSLGVIDPLLTLAQAKYGSIPYATINANYVANSGYIKVDPAYPLSSQITYVPYV